MLHKQQKAAVFSAALFAVTQSANAFISIAKYSRSSLLLESTCRRPASNTALTDTVSEMEALQTDATGKPIFKGKKVRTLVPLTAFQVPRRGYGRIDPETFEFIPREEPFTARTDMCLEIPPGMVGTVTKVYDTVLLGACHPIVVKFKGGEGEEGSPIPPLNFFQHFDNHEIEVVE